MGNQVNVGGDFQSGGSNNAIEEWRGKRDEGFSDRTWMVNIAYWSASADTGLALANGLIYTT